ncbi:hypothetical protein AB3X26_07855, partial [Raoultella planticola]
MPILKISNTLIMLHPVLSGSGGPGGGGGGGGFGKKDYKKGGLQKADKKKPKRAVLWTGYY